MKNDPWNPLLPSEKYVTLINNLDVPAKFKQILKSVLALTYKVKGRVVEIGKKIIELIIWAIEKHPDAALKALVGTILFFLAAHIPILGHLLAPVIAGLTVFVVASDVLLSEAFRKHVEKLFGSLT